MISDLCEFGFEGHLIDTDKIYYVGPLARKLAESPRHSRHRYQDYVMISLGGAQFPIQCPPVPFSSDDLPSFDEIAAEPGLVRLREFFVCELKRRGAGACAA